MSKFPPSCSTEFDFLSTKPEEPTDADCCHNGCKNCVFDIYQKALCKWNEKCELRYKTLKTNFLSLTKFKPCIVINIKKLTNNTNLYTFKPSFEEETVVLGCLDYRAAQHISLRLKVKPGMEEHEINTSHCIKNFTIISLPEETIGSFDMIIKLYENSFTSNYIKSLKVGDICFWRGPYGDFDYEYNKYSNLIMLCMGTGIAPMYPICKKIVNNEKDETVITLLYGCRSSSDIILRKELHDLASFWNFHYTYFLSQEKQEGQMYCFENIVTSRITYDEVHSHIKTKRNFFVLVCGSSNFSNDMKIILLELGVPKDKMYIF